MSEDEGLRPATAEEIADSLAFALRYEGRKRVAHADEMMARITADTAGAAFARIGVRGDAGPPNRAPTDKPGG